MNREQALVDLGEVASFVANETSICALRVRLIMPWLDQVSRWQVGWRERIDALRPIFPESDRSIDEELTRVRRVVGQARGRPNKTSIDLPAEHRRIAAAAGVSLPGYSDNDTPPPGVVINYLLRTLEQQANALAAGGRPAARVDRNEPAPRTRPSPAAPSHAGHVEPSRAKAGEGGSVAPGRFAIQFTESTSPSSASSTPSILDLTRPADQKVRPSAKDLEAFIETEDQRLEREIAERRARAEKSGSKILFTQVDGPPGSVGEQ
jgi:hypothetical protein